LRQSEVGVLEKRLLNVPWGGAGTAILACVPSRPKPDWV